MGTRYTKSIPEKVYFQELQDGWIAGPFVKKPKGKYLAFKLIPDTEYMRFVIPIGELTAEQAIERLKELKATYSEELDMPDAEIYLEPNKE
jgi:hypothetical protein